ncbi:hypothetical protein GOALK_097_01510 [Gordonia alkanivorans NBRC 16433]|jgi:hypothetical protein|uniref:Uncharacterized protein n=2 Tax=Gordonia alkanivorans TaxID=84096 RepID=F9VZT4_9ACTN|nr:hypothetical protein C5O27_09315 [Gordonia alkanivorans]ETA06848.1 hypothetical protein V525_11165 [Gordonia alkanivorans CGMCC 6845]GAA14123.1 hypothetical protein GOALK_097_01510 [Gordonia alkanivorans NBRC 16433]
MFGNSSSREARGDPNGPATWFAVRSEVKGVVMAAVPLAIVCGLVLLASIVRTVLAVAGDGRRRVRYREAYDTRRPTL